MGPAGPCRSPAGEDAGRAGALLAPAPTARYGAPHDVDLASGGADPAGPRDERAPRGVRRSEGGIGRGRGSRRRGGRGAGERLPSVGTDGWHAVLGGHLRRRPLRPRVRVRDRPIPFLRHPGHLRGRHLEGESADRHPLHDDELCGVSRQLRRRHERGELRGRGVERGRGDAGRLHLLLLPGGTLRVHERLPISDAAPRRRTVAHSRISGAATSRRRRPPRVRYHGRALANRAPRPVTTATTTRAEGVPRSCASTAVSGSQVTIRAPGDPAAARAPHRPERAAADRSARSCHRSISIAPGPRLNG